MCIIAFGYSYTMTLALMSGNVMKCNNNEYRRVARETERLCAANYAARGACVRACVLLQVQGLRHRLALTNAKRVKYHCAPPFPIYSIASAGQGFTRLATHTKFVIS